MIVTIDGPAGAGKSSVARALARRLGFRFLDTGAMYRAVALAAMRRGLPWDEPQRLAELAGRVSIEFPEERVVLDGLDVTGEIRTKEVTAVVRYAADNPGVREQLVELQRRAAGNDDLVTEGRDQGTVVFPHAQCKIFLTASAEERAQRRLRDFQQRGQSASFDEVLSEQNERDRRDSTRDVGPLIPATDAIEVSTDGLTPDQVVDRLAALVQQRLGQS